MKTLTLLLTLLASASVAAGAAIHDIAGVQLGMSKDDVRTQLAKTATFERNERRRQEIWTLNADPRFTSLIVGYSKEGKVRFVTAVAKPNGAAVRYADVLDLAEAKHKSAGSSHTYTWVTGTPAYTIIAIGGPAKLDYLSLENEH